ncbi:unnamed protein product [Caenorhabditis brenneri]
MIGNDAIAFYDFQFWYYRFLSGKQDLDFDRSSEPDPLQFSDLPIDVVGLIVDKLEVVERLMLRKVSKPLRDLVEKQDFHCTKITVSCGNNLIVVSYGKGQGIYAKNEKAVKLNKRLNYGRDALVIHGDDYESEAFNDLAWILKRPRLQIERLDLSKMLPCFENALAFKFYNKIKFMLKSLKHQISVKKLDLQPECPDDILAILPYLKPGYLEEISIKDFRPLHDWRGAERKIQQIIQLDQWKQAKELSLPLKMAESLKNDHKSIRSYILNDVLEKVPIDKSYENLCKVIGNDAIAFYDFQFWYYRFFSGKQDLDFDRSTEPEPLQFSDLPVDAVGLIADKLEMVEKLVLRRVSKPLREFIEKQVFDCTRISVSCDDDFIRVSYGNRQILYTKNDAYFGIGSINNHSLIIHGDESEVCNDLACVLKNPKLQLSHFTFSSVLSCHKYGVLSTFLPKFGNVWKSLKHQIAVRELVFRPKHPDDVLAILPYLKPGYLEEISIDNSFGMFDWKSDENRPSPGFEYCRFKIKYPEDFDDFLVFIGVPPFAEDYFSVRHYMIPNTDKLLIIKKFLSGDVEIEKKARRVQ